MKKIILMTFVITILTANVAFGISIVDIACGDNHTVLLAEDGTVWTMGDNSKGQCGFGPEVTKIYYPMQIKNLPKMTKVEAAANSTMLLDEDGRAYKITSTGELSPILIDGVVDMAIGYFVQANNGVAKGEQFALLTSDGSVYTSGATGTVGYLGKGPGEYDYETWGKVKLSSTEPLPKIRKIFFGYGIGCISEDGFLYVATHGGYMSKVIQLNKMQELAVVAGAYWVEGVLHKYQTSPIVGHNISDVVANDRVINMDEIVDIAYDPYCTLNTFIILTENGEVYDVNDNVVTRNYGVYGKKIVKVAKGKGHKILLDEDGNVYAYGDNSYGQLGLKRAEVDVMELIAASTYYNVKQDIFGMPLNLQWILYSYNSVTKPTLIESLQEIVPSEQSSLAYITSDARVWIEGIANFSLMFEVKEDMTLRNTNTTLHEIFTNGALNIKVYKVYENGTQELVPIAQGLVYNIYENGVNITQTITPNFVFKSGKLYQLECGIGGVGVFTDRYGETRNHYIVKFEGMNASKVKDGVVTQMRSTVDIAKFALKVFVTELANLQ